MFKAGKHVYPKALKTLLKAKNVPTQHDIMTEYKGIAHFLNFYPKEV